MSSRLSRFLNDWKAYAAFITALLSGVSTFLDQFTGFVAKLEGVGIPAEIAKWLLPVAFGLAAVPFLLAALARRSELLRPERFIVSADDPHHLVGREGWVEKLAETCEKNALTILKGESGAGKSALVKAGLLPHLDPTTSEHQLLPLYLDASGLDWDGGLRTELARALAAWPKERRQALGDDGKPASGDKVFARLAGLPELAGKRLLLILDQIDDYFVTHRVHFLDAAGLVVGPAQLEAANPDWASLAGLVRRKRLHLLLVCRKDEDMLSALHFKPEPKYFPLARIEGNVISPLFEELTRDDGKGAVVDDPDAGWVQLKARLLRDLAEDGQILPVRLALVLESLSGFRFLTLTQYSKHGGARGLDRLYVERLLRDAKNALGLDPAVLVKALALLAEGDGSKTRRVRLADFATALPVGTATEVVGFLEQTRLLRRQSGQDGSFLLLYHDYLAQGVQEAYRQANQRTESLRIKGKEFDEALTWRQRWRALLPLSDQVQLGVARLRGRFTYGVYRSFALWSLLAFTPFFAGMAAIGLVASWGLLRVQEQEAMQLVNRLVNEPWTASGWIDLAKASERIRFYATQQVLSNLSSLEALSGRDEDLNNSSYRGEVLIHSLVGFDPDGSFSARLLREAFIPAVRSPNVATIRVEAIGSWAGKLHLRKNQDEVKTLAAMLVERMKTELDSYRLGYLGVALAGLSDKVDNVDVKPGATVLVERIKTESKSSQFSSLVYAIARLSGKLDIADVKPVAVALVDRIETQPYFYELYNLGIALVWLGDKLDSTDAKIAAAALVARMKTEPESANLRDLGIVLAGLSKKLDRADVKPGAITLLEYMKTSQDPVTLIELVRVQTLLAGMLESADVKLLIAALLERMRTEPNLLRHRTTIRIDSYEYGPLSKDLAELCGKLDSADAKPLAAALVERMKTEPDIGRLQALADALVRLGGKLDSADAKPLAAVLVERMKTEPDIGRLPALTDALIGLGGKLDSVDVKPGAEVLVAHMKTERDPDSLSNLCMPLVWLVSKLKLDNPGVKPCANALVEQMKTEQSNYKLVSLVQALASLSDKLDSADTKLITDWLANRLRTDPDNAASLAIPWSIFEQVAYAHKDPNARIADYVEFLHHPLIVGEPQKVLLDSLGKITGQDFHGDLWQFVDWAQTEKGRKYGIKLD